MANYTRKIEEIIYRLRRNYPLYPSTFNPCLNPGCKDSARGNGICASCCEKRLAEVSGEPEASSEFHEAVKDQTRLQSVLLRITEND